MHKSIQQIKHLLDKIFLYSLYLIIKEGVEHTTQVGAIFTSRLHQNVDDVA